MDEHRKIALITGAGSGIGRIVAKALAADDYHVLLAGRRANTLDKVRSEISGDGGHADSVVADVTDPGSVSAMFAWITETFGRLDLLFNNAGVFARAQPLEDISYAHWREVVDSILTGSFLCTQGAFRLMKSQSPQGGRIINNGSISAHVPRPMSSPYTAAKHGMTGLTKSTSLDGRAFGIACGQIDIGNAATNMTAQMQSGILQANGTMMSEPVFDARHVADAILFMANLPLGANAQFITISATTMPFIGRG